ncbi:DNA primase large subunit [Strongylocentrotus purpuratus]|uniref:DNA primase large subunit n=1 Tax=Strongylocentrotus purpuratus TaxID=7668 RepID=A0A7M7NPZ2_STRPU|nr:DNA primase large subunit [Strongylocentrotus purpuratus]
MEFSENSTKKRIKKESFVDKTKEPHLLFYRIPPIENISLSEFEELAKRRLAVLKHVESVGIRHVKGSEEYNERMDKELKKLMPIAHRKMSGEDLAAHKRDDRISHFILRLAYCRSEDLRRWFIQQELDLFRYRFLREYSESVTQFLAENKLHYTPIPENEKDALNEKLVRSSPGISASMMAHTDFFKVPFTEALDLVRGRKVFIQKGYAFVPHSELVSIVITAFRSHLSQSLAITARGIPHLEEDGRLLPMLNNLSKQYLGQDYSNSKRSGNSAINLEDIEKYSKQSFPLCMRQLHMSLKEHHHLRHGGRMQYGLFLKGIGMTLEQAMTFWRSEFTRIMDMDKFDKQYSYNIRHNYGKEGKRANYTPYSCMKVIMSNAPGQGDYHGCPFRHTDGALLKQRLSTFGLTQQGVDQVMELVKGHHYQLACTRYFELSHNVPETEFLLNHPNQYFEESLRVRGGGTGRKEGFSSTPSNRKPVSRYASTPSQNNSQSPSTAPSQAKVKTDPEAEFDEMDISFEEAEALEKALQEATTA